MALSRLFHASFQIIVRSSDAKHHAPDLPVGVLNEVLAFS